MSLTTEVLGDITTILERIVLTRFSYSHKSARGNTLRTFSLNNFIQKQEFKNLLYSRYNRSNIYNILPSKRLITEYINIIDRVEKQTLETSWYFRKNLENGAMLLQKGFTEKTFRLDKFNPNINPALVPEGNILSFERPYFFQDSEWFWVLGDNFPSIEDDELFRYYFNFNGVNFEGLTVLLRFLINEFDSRNVSYKLKFPIDQTYFSRADNIVLFIDKFHFSIVADLIYRLSFLLYPFLRQEVPLFTKQINRGIGFSEEPRDETHQSFGQNRIDTLCEALESIRNTFNFNQVKELTDSDLIEQVGSYFDKKDPNRSTFYLNEDSLYLSLITPLSDNFYPPILKVVNFPKNQLVFQNKVFQNTFFNNFFDISLFKIAYQLSSSCLVNESKQVWLKGEMISDNEKQVLILSGTDFNFYNGSLGIAWFLLNVYKLYKEPLFLKPFSRIKHIFDDCNGGMPWEVLYFLLDSQKTLKTVLNSTEIEIIGGDTNYQNCFQTLFNNFSINPNNLLNSLIDLLWMTDVINEFDIELKINIGIKNKLKSFYTSVYKENLLDTLNIEEKTNNIKFCVYVKTIELMKIFGEHELIIKAVRGLRGVFTIDNLLNSNIKLLSIQILTDFLGNIKSPDSNVSYAFENDLKTLQEDSLKEFGKFSPLYSSNSYSLSGDILPFVSFLVASQSNRFIVSKSFKSPAIIPLVVDNFLKELCTNTLAKDIFPNLGLDSEFYNPGLNDGIVGIGYVLLRNFKDIKSLPIQCFLEK